MIISLNRRSYPVSLWNRLTIRFSGAARSNWSDQTISAARRPVESLVRRGGDDSALHQRSVSVRYLTIRLDTPPDWARSSYGSGSLGNGTLIARRQRMNASIPATIRIRSFTTHDRTSARISSGFCIASGACCATCHSARFAQRPGLVAQCNREEASLAHQR